MPRHLPPSPRRRARTRARLLKVLALLALCTLSLTALALSGNRGAPLRHWLQTPLRILSVDDLPGIDDDIDSDRIVRARSVIERWYAVARRAWPHAVTPMPLSRPHGSPARLFARAGDDGAAIPSAQTDTPRGTGAGASTGARSAPAALTTLRTDVSYIDKSSPAYARFKAFVDSALSGDPDYGFSASDAVLMALTSGQASYCTLAVRTVDKQVTDAETEIAAGRAPEVAGDSYLYAGPMIADLSTTYRHCSAQTTATQRTRWAAYAEQTVWNIWNFANAAWGGKKIPWSGWSVSNPGNNYHYSFLEATMSWALASHSRTWLDFLRQKKLPPLTTYFAKLPGGGSNEGTGYGTSHMTLFSDYMLWRDGAGQDLGSASSHLNGTIHYWVHATVPTLDRFAPIGDQARVSTPDIYDYQRRVVIEARWLSIDPKARDIASWWLTHISLKQMSSGFNARYDLLPVGSNSTAPDELVYFAKGTGHLFARTGWDRGAMWVNFIAGPYNESHAHQEQGGFTLFAVDWLAVTENIWTHSGIQQGTPEHNVLRFERAGNVVPQADGTVSSMTVTPGAADGAFSALANLKPAYGGNAAVGSWTRQLDFAARRLTVTDKFAVSAGTTATFQVNVPVKPVVSGNLITAGKLRIRVLSPASPTIRLIDWTTVDRNEYLKGWRVDIGGSASGYKVELADQ